MPECPYPARLRRDRRRLRDRPGAGGAPYARAPTRVRRRERRYGRHRCAPGRAGLAGRDRRPRSTGRGVSGRRSDQPSNRLPELFNPQFLPRARHDHLVIPELEGVPQLTLAVRSRGPGHRVALRERREHGGLALGEQLLHRAVVVGGFAADVEQPEDAREAGAVEHVCDEEPKRPAVGLGGSGVAVAGEIQQIQGAGSREQGAVTAVSCSLLPAPCSQGIHVQHPSLAGGSRDLRYPPARQGVQEAGLSDVGAAEQRDFGEGGSEYDVGPGEGAEEAGFGSGGGQASFFWRTRSVTSSGCRPSETHSAVMATSRTSSRLGRSNMMSVIISSRMARRPRAPVPRLIAFWAIALSASFSIVRRTSSSSNSFWYCLDSAFLGSMRMRMSASSSSESSGTATGSRPTSSGISP